MKGKLKLENICKTITNPRPRKDVYLYDFDGVNEALINVIIHNGYRITQPQISFLDDRLEILSHGGLPNGMTKDDFFNGISKPRNAQLMNIFIQFQISEHTDHGIPTIIRIYGTKAFKITDNYILVKIPFNNEVLNIIKTENGVRNGTRNGARSGARNFALCDEEKKVLKAIKNNYKITMRQLSKELKISFRKTQRIISSLNEKEIIKHIGSTKAGYWKIIELNNIIDDDNNK